MPPKGSPPRFGCSAHSFHSLSHRSHHSYCCACGQRAGGGAGRRRGGVSAECVLTDHTQHAPILLERRKGQRSLGLIVGVISLSSSGGSHRALGGVERGAAVHIGLRSDRRARRTKEARAHWPRPREDKGERADAHHRPALPVCCRLARWVPAQPHCENEVVPPNLGI